LTVSTFSASAKTAFVGAMSATLGVSSSAINITGVTNVARRHLLQSGVAVAFTVEVASSSAATSMASTISSVASNPTAFVSALNSGLTASGLPVISGVTVTQPVVAAPVVAPINVTSITNASAAAQAVTASFNNLTTAEATLQQAALLNGLESGAAAGNLSATAADTAASLVLAVVSATPNVTLSVKSQSAALNVLAQVASAPINSTGAVAQTITEALSLVASSAGESNPAALVQVQNVINSIASSQATSLAASLAVLPPGAPPPAPAVTNSPTIQALVQVDPPGGSRLTSMPLTAPGLLSTFQPILAGLLPKNSTIVTQFFSLAFDPNGASTVGGPSNNSGVTRLAFSDLAGSTIPVANVSTPIVFTLLRVSTPGDTDNCVGFRVARAPL